MSQQPQQQITPEEARRGMQALVYRMSELENYINNLNASLSALLNEVEEIRIARLAVEAIRDRKDIPVLITLDRRGHVFIEGNIGSGNALITHIGSDYYALLSPDKTLQILDEKEDDLRRAITLLRNELVKATKLYEDMRKTLATLASIAQGKRTERS